MRWLRLELWDVLDTASDVPEAAELSLIWTLLDNALVSLELDQQLQVAGTAIAQIAEIVEERSRLVLDELETLGDYSGPIMSPDAFDRFVRQSMQVNFDPWIERIESPLPRASRERSGSDSIVQPLDAETLLALIEEPAPEMMPPMSAEQMVLQLAGEECPEEWIAAIAQWLATQTEGTVIPLTQLCQVLGLSRVEVWMGLLLGEYGPKLQRRSKAHSMQDFYQDFYDIHGIELCLSGRSLHPSHQPTSDALG